MAELLEGVERDGDGLGVLARLAALEDVGDAGAHVALKHSQTLKKIIANFVLRKKNESIRVIIWIDLRLRLRNRTMSQATHVSSSVLSGKTGEADRNDWADKGLAVTTYVVGALFAEKKRALSELVEADMASLRAGDTPDLQCACFRRRNDADLQWGVDEPCAERLKLRQKMFRKIARERWPELEKALVSDLAHCIYDAKSAHGALTRQLAEDSAAASRIMRKQRKTIGALQHELGRLKREAHEAQDAQARTLEDARGETEALRAQMRALFLNASA